MLRGSLVEGLGAGTHGVNVPTETVEGEPGASQRGACATFSRADPPDGSVSSTALGGRDPHQLLHQICTIAVRACGSARVENGGGSTSGENATS
jgi:hypothetical protein